ncbi:Kinesin [Phytophthora megakarya]|uniref:Kinesin n=1 Tax=Phytophthora megakarya TaxID=4795 RepID=A0A225WX83_9STRA|nr:Kinesin [Phytophthora megakarya]
MNERETRANDAPALACVPKLNVVSLTDPETGAPLSGKGNVFQYDQIFDAASDSRAIYECVGRRIVHSTLGGINGTVFAYGQTSSGKTFTMQGDSDMPFSESTNSHPGILQLAVEDIFNYIENCEDRDFLLRVSFLEIYNEVVKDLLNVSEKGANLKLREDPRKGVYVESKEEIITNYEDIVTLLQTGNQNRTTGQTAMNEKSSRSHSVFRIVIESKQKTDSRRLSEEDVNGAVLVASLNLVDLAGSESLRHTGAEGIRQREAGNINKSLLTLSRVINSLASSGGKGQNAPFRDSKLTRLLQNSLGGNTRTLIVCCVTPSDRFIEETKSTLQFAARAKDIKTTATVNEVLDDQTQLRPENEALISEKNHNKAEMARLMGLILSSSSVTKENVGKKRKQRGELQEIVQELAQLQCDHEKTALEKEELRTENERIREELDASQRQGFEMSETLIELEHKAKVLQAQLDAKIMTISQMQTKHSIEVEKLQHSIQDITNEKEKLLVEIQELGAGEVTGTNETETVKTDATDITTGMTKDENLDVDTETQKLRLEVKQLTEKLSAVELELAETKECPHVLLKDSAEHDELKAAYNKLQTDFDNLQQLNKAGTDATLEKQDDHTEVSVSDAGQNIDPPSCSLQHQFDVLTGDYKLVKEQFENVSRERNDCVEELRAVECQLMEVSEERMKLAISIDEMEVKLREMEHVASTSSVTISTLQMQLKEAESAKATLEVSNVELEQTVENVQNTLTALQADHAAIAEQIQHGDTVSTVGVECSTEIEKLQQRLESEAKQHEKLELDVQSYEETLSVLRQEAKDRSATIADLSEKIRILEAELDSAALTREKKDKELAKLADALARSEEEQHEMRLQSKQRLVAAEGKEVALEEKISALKQQLNTSSTAMSLVSIPMQDEPQSGLQAELQAKITTLENQLAEGRDELQKKDLAWSQKEEMTEIEITRLTTEQKQLHEQLSALRNGVEDSRREMESQAEELEKAQRSCAELLTQKEASERELEAAKTAWEEKQQDLMCQLDSIQQQFHGAQVELEEYQKNADGEIIRLRSVIDELKHSSKAREEELESQMGEQESWQNQVQSRQEALQAKCDELDDERRLLREKYAALEFQHGDVEGRLQNEIDEMSQKYAAVQKQQSTYQAKLKEMEAQLEMTENDVAQSRRELQSAANSLKASQMEVVQHHNELVEAQSSKESMEKLIEQQKARIDKLEKVKMTTDILDMFRKLKQDRHDLKVKVKELKKDLIQAERALTHTQGSHQEKKQTLLEHNDDELMQLKEHVEDLRESLRVEKHRSADLRSEMRAALNDEREKAEHEIEEMQALVKEKLELVEKLESQLASVENALVKLRKEKSGNVSYLEKENLELHVENRELRKHLESTTLLPEKDDLMGDTGTYDASAAAAVKALNGDSIANESEVKLTANATEITSKQKDCATKAGGFLLSTTELDAIAAESQEDPKARERPECSQQ